MATVYRAFDLRHERAVAVKVMQSALADDPGFQERFQRESRVVKRINSQFIVGVEHSDIHHHADGTRLFFFVTALADGDLRETLICARARGVTVPTRWILDVIWQVACGLDSAHEAKVQHGDVKPSNILIFDYDETDLDVPPHAELGDFGIARADALTGGADERHMLSEPYASPEQWDGQITAKGDQYSLACTLYEALCAAPPYGFAGNLREAHLSGRPPALSARASPHLPRALDPVLAKALSRDPDDRYSNCRTFVRAARSAAQPEPQEPPTVTAPTRVAARHPREAADDPPTTQPPRRRPATPGQRRPTPPRRARGPVAALALVIVAGAVALYALTRSGGDHPPTTTASTAASSSYDRQAMLDLRALIGYPTGADDPCRPTDFTKTAFGRAPAGVIAAYTCTPNNQRATFFEVFGKPGQAEAERDAISRGGESVTAIPCQAGEPIGSVKWTRTRTGDHGFYVCLNRTDGGVARSWDVISADNARMLVAVLARGPIADAVSEFDRVKPKSIF